MAHDLSNAEISVEGEFHTCEACGLDSRDEALFSIHEWGTQCAPGFGCNTYPSERSWPEREQDDAHEDAVDAALERGER